MSKTGSLITLKFWFFGKEKKITSIYSSMFLAHQKFILRGKKGHIIIFRNQNATLTKIPPRF